MDGDLEFSGFTLMVSIQGVDVWQRDMRKFWEPLFDSYHVAVGFENHSHRYGRAIHLKAGKVGPVCIDSLHNCTLTSSRRRILRARSTWAVEALA